MLPHDALDRRKSPYTATQNPAYLAGGRERALVILSDPSSPILALLDSAKLVARPPESDTFASPFEAVIQIDGWLTHYGVELV